MKRGLLCVGFVFVSLMAGCIILPLPLPSIGGDTLPAVTPTPAAPAAPTVSATPAASPTPAAVQSAAP